MKDKHANNETLRNILLIMSPQEREEFERAITEKVMANVKNRYMPRRIVERDINTLNTLRELIANFFDNDLSFKFPDEK